MARRKWNDAIARALLLIPQHPEVLSVGTPITCPDGTLAIDVTYRVSLPQDWLEAGESPSGVRARETVRLHFPATYPVNAPVPSLRPDFDRAHPHILPHKQGDRPIPCISDLPLNSLLHQQGLRGILNQTAYWLANAALGTLIDPEQGWEPMRRDDLPHAITFDATSIRKRVTRTGGHVYLPFLYASLALERGGVGVRGLLTENPITFNSTNIEKHVQIKKSGLIHIGRSIALMIWPGKKPSGEPFICEKYQPEDVTNFSELLARARDYGFEQPLSEQLSWLRRAVGRRTPAAEIPVAFIFAVRRPIHLIGTSSEIELLCYIARYQDLVKSNWENASVEAAAHNQQIGVDLCRRLSGTKDSKGKWTLIGAGSLGSKVALHLSRQGIAPSHVVDSSTMRAHNSVRHGLMPPPEHMQMVLASPKADLLCESIASLHQVAEPVYRDVVGLLLAPEDRRLVASKNTSAIVNSTASIRVREALAMLSAEELPAPVIETSLFSNGRIGLMTLEGSQRNPNTGDLISEFYRIAGASPELAESLFHSGADLSRVNIGEGCGSATMVLSDSRISLHAASMSQFIADELSTPSRSGRIAVGSVSDDGMSIKWKQENVPPVNVVEVMHPDAWSVRISRSVEAALVADIEKWPGVETGGILLGRLSEAAQTFYVVDVFPAPLDSRRSAALFELGIEGVRAGLKRYSEQHGWTLYCLGTWHSHLGSSTPSRTDTLTAQTIALARVTPSLLLIKAPGGYSALVADAANLV